MKKNILSLLLLFSVVTYSQTNFIDTKDIYISFDKTTHLIFPTEIKYFTGVEELIILKKAGKNVLSVKANVKDFSNTNVNVATADGNFYAFDVHYKEQNDKTNYFVQTDSTAQEVNTLVNMNNLYHIVFPNPIKYIDYGADWIEAKPIDNIQNIVRVETFEEIHEPTNISVIDTKDNFYTFSVAYNENATNFNLVVGNPEQTALLAKEDLSDNSKEIILEKLKQHGRNIKNLGVKQNSVLFTIQNVFVLDNKLIFRFNFENLSHVKYDIDYIKFYVIDKKQTKESALQEVEYNPLFLDNFKNVIEGKQNNTYSVCFEKFTIPDKKYFIIEINEKNGGRHIRYKIDNRVIENAQAL